jgi:hypothetical protein
MHLETPNSIVFSPTALALMRLKFQSFLQTSECWDDNTEWHDRAPPTITQYRMQLVGPLTPIHL